MFSRHRITDSHFDRVSRCTTNTRSCRNLSVTAGRTVRTVDLPSLNCRNGLTVFLASYPRVPSWTNSFDGCRYLLRNWRTKSKRRRWNWRRKSPKLIIYCFNLCQGMSNSIHFNLNQNKIHPDTLYTENIFISKKVNACHEINNDGRIDWSIDCLIDSSIYWLLDWLIDWLIDWFFEN